jgi:hypothetical protein
MTRALVELWATTVFFPTLDQRRGDLAYQGKALLLMNELGLDNSWRSGQLLTFDTMKRPFSASKFHRWVNRQSDQALRMLGGWFSASFLHYNVEVFMSLGLIPVERDGRFLLTVHSEKAPRVRGLRKVEPVAGMLPPDSHGRFRLPTGI